ncbi:hypothetical protein JYT25_00610 [bacterium AH-315-C20]|nr:hypothetical protein [bacterium AH-315-C20]
MQSHTIQTTLSDYYKDNDFRSDGGEKLPYAKAKLTSWLNIYIPNPEVRRKILQVHDVHHLLTGFKTSMTGESEISAWEISSGCRSNWFAFFINSLGVISVILFNPWNIWKAYKLGKRTKNLYKAGYGKEELLAMTVEELQEELGFGKTKFRQRMLGILIFISFSLFLIVALIMAALAFAIFPLIIIYSIYWAIKLA